MPIKDACRYIAISAFRETTTHWSLVANIFDSIKYKNLKFQSVLPLFISSRPAQRVSIEEKRQPDKLKHDSFFDQLVQMKIGK